MKSILRSGQLFAAGLWREFNRDQCIARASGLAFASLLALVPVTALLFSLFSSLDSFSGIVESIQAFLIRMLVPTKQEEILSSITRFVENTRGLGVFGLLLFLITSVLLLATIQRTFDALWGTASKKNTLKKLATYASVLIVGSFLMSLGLNVTGALASFAGTIFPDDAGWIRDALPRIVAILLLFAALFFMIRFLPAGPVRSKSSLLGAVVGTVLWEIARLIFVFWANYVIRLSVIYGSLAVVPIFLIWLYLAWMIVLLSVEVAYVYQHGGHRAGGRAVWELEPAEVLRCGLGIYLLIAGDFIDGNKPPSTLNLAGRLSLADRDAAYLVGKFVASGLLVQTGERGYVPSRALSAISAEEVAGCVFGNYPNPDSIDGRTDRLYRDMVRAAFESIKNLSIRDVIDSGGVHSREQVPAEEDTSRFKNLMRRFRRWASR